MAVKAKVLTVKIPWIGEITFVADEIQQRAAWSLYVELQTRIAVQALDDEAGIMREALDSLYALYDITREILREAGPDVADGENSFGPIAIRVLNEGLRPFTQKWHPRLKLHELNCPPEIDAIAHERNWIVNGVDFHAQMRDELVDLQTKIVDYADILAQISGAKHVD